MIIPLIFIIIGLLLLILGAESLVKGSASLSRRLGVSNLVIGLTVVAFGTSLPELVVSLYSSLRGSSDVTIGNIVGSNISNVLLVLGAAALIRPLKVKSSTIWKEIPFSLLAMVLIFTMGNDALFDKSTFNAITRIDGLSLISLFGIFLFYIYSQIRKNPGHKHVEVLALPLSVLMTIAGLGLLVIGGKILVDNGVILAQILGFSEMAIGLTVIAVGTSLPELVTTVVAVMQREDDIAVGNIIGSNILNIFWIIGVTSTIIPLPFNPQLDTDIIFSIGTKLLLFAFMFIGERYRLDRWQGAFFLLLYAVYTGFLLIRG